MIRQAVGGIALRDGASEDQVFVAMEMGVGVIHVGAIDQVVPASFRPVHADQADGEVGAYILFPAQYGEVGGGDGIFFGGLYAHPPQGGVARFSHQPESCDDRYDRTVGGQTDTA